MALGFIFRIVIIKFRELIIEEAPAKWREKIVKSTEFPEWKITLDNGGYTVQPVPLPWETIRDVDNKINDERSNQNLMLFIRGKAISGVAIIMGINQFPKPPIIVGITIKKIIIKACAVTIELKVWSLCSIEPGWFNSNRIMFLKEVPSIADQIPKPKYIVPISLWFVE